MYIYHSSFIHSSANRHLGCVHVLTILSSAAVNNVIHVSLSILVSSGYMSTSGIAGSYAGYISSFLKESLQWLYQFTFPPAMQESSLFSTPSLAFIVCRLFFFNRLFDDDHSDWCEVVSHCSFDLHFSNNE